MASRKRRASKKGSGAPADAPWRAPVGHKPIPRISSPPLLSLADHPPPNFDYAVSIMRHPDPIGMELATEAFIEAAGPDCLIPGQEKPVRILGLQVWPIEIPQINFKALEPISREVKTFSKMVDKAFDIMQAPFGER